MKLLIAKLTCILRFKTGMSVRNISLIVKEIFGLNYSTGQIVTLCQKVARRAREKMEFLNRCSQKRAKMMIADETFPQTQTLGTTSLGVVVDEFGLIRKVKAIVRRKKDLLELFRSVCTFNFKPFYFMSDYDKVYPRLINKINESLILFKDFIHAVRMIRKNAGMAMNNVKAKGRGKLTNQRKKEMTALKRKLLRKRLFPLLSRMFKGFAKEYASVGTIYLEGTLVDLKELAERYPSLRQFYEKTAKFIRKYIDIWAVQMEMGSKEGLPTTSNAIESKNSIFKVFTKRSKCFETKTTMEEFFLAVALMENFDIKTRGKNQGTSAMMRAGINLDEFGATSFFEAVNLTEIALRQRDTLTLTISDLQFYLHQAA